MNGETPIIFLNPPVIPPHCLKRFLTGDMQMTPAS
jgi:hypothetical protein